MFETVALTVVAQYFDNVCVPVTYLHFVAQNRSDRKQIVS